MRRKKGQAIVEMALVFPFFLLIIVGGIIDFGFAMYNSLTLQQIANDSAQWAADNRITETTAITNYITDNDKIPSWWQGKFAEPIVETPDLDSGGKVVRVRLGYESPTYTPFYQTMLSGITGSPSISLYAIASYKIPQHVYSKM